MNGQASTQVDINALFTFGYGLYIVGTEWEGRLNGQVADAVMQLTADPICMAACLHRNNYTAELLEKSRKFSVSVFSEDAPLPFIGNFGFRSGREHDKYANCTYEMGALGVPLVTEHTVAVVEAELLEIAEVHTHRLFVGTVTSARLLNDKTPLTYANYHRLKKGKSHANAPSAVFNAIR